MRILTPTILAALLLVACREAPAPEIAAATETAIEIPSASPETPVTTTAQTSTDPFQSLPTTTGGPRFTPLVPTPQSQSPELVDRMPAAEVAELMRAGDVVVVDVRYAEQYAAGHIPGSISMPLPELAFRASELPRGKLIVAYCT